MIGIASNNLPPSHLKIIDISGTPLAGGKESLWLLSRPTASEPAGAAQIEMSLKDKCLVNDNYVGHWADPSYEAT